ncbi:MAG: SufE family protein [Rhabdochlamydiaceae bacterium]|nr:SufE family protein [Rhabdochlamydiaceae bacterium]
MTKIPSYTELTYLYEQKHEALLKNFPASTDPKQVYETIIELGRTLPPIPDSIKTAENLVSGCQSEVYLSTRINEDGKIFYEIGSEALISSGLAALLLLIYQGEVAELILLCPPRFISELGLAKSLSPGRAGGLASIYARMKQEATKLYLQKNANP